MNLLQNPTTIQLADLFNQAKEDDTNILWTEHNGKVHLDPVPANLSPLGYANQLGNRIRLRYGVYTGKGYCGANLPADDSYIEFMFDKLIQDWNEGKTGEDEDI